jgi:protein tyrosine phosphatase (PTP) superfamily phosphohydrolase (DUF442 family)
MASADFNVQSEDLRNLFQDVRKFSPELAKELRRNLAAAAGPVVEDAKSAARSLPSKGAIGGERKKKGSHLSLRQSLAAATQVRVVPGSNSARVEIRISSSRFESVSGRPNSLVFYVEELNKRWRHPVFGNLNNWVQQKGTPYFFQAVRSAKAENHFVSAVDRALIKAIEAIGK